MANGFWNDGNGISDKDFEKLILGVLFFLIVVVILFKYVSAGIADLNMIYLATSTGALFVARKGLSYFKPERYNGTTQESDSTETTTQN